VSLMLCFFNLIPIPPLDGSQVVRVLSGMSYETYAQLIRYGPFILIIVINIPQVSQTLRTVTTTAWNIIGSWFGIVA